MGKHGGKRQGSGRKAGEVTKRTRAIADQAVAKGISPLEVMLENMLHFQRVACDAEAVLESLADQKDRENIGPEEQFKAMLAEVKKAAGLRAMAQDCARDAAPYIHSRLATTSVAISGTVTLESLVVGSFKEDAAA